MHIKGRYFLYFIGVIFWIGSRTVAQQQDIGNYTFYYPHPLEVKQMIHMAGLSTAKLPEDVVETDDIIRAPLFSYEIKFGLPENLLVYGGVHTNIVSNQFALGAEWNYNFSRLGIAAGTNLAFWFGRLKQFGFNTSYTGWILYPNLSIGYRFNKFAASLRSEIVLNLTETSKNGGIKVTDNSQFFNGFTIGVYLEQPLWKDNFVVIGLRSTYLKFYYPMWAAFSTFDRTFFIPEFTFKFIL